MTQPNERDTKREAEARERATAASMSATGGLPGDEAAGAGPEWRGRLEELRENRRSRKRWTTRLREPLIGLTMAGAAAPVAYGVKHLSPEAKGGAGSKAVPENRSASQLPADIEDAVGAQWAQAHEAQLRNDTIEGAIARYGIDRPLAEAIYDVAEEEGIEPDLAYGLVNTESTFRNDVTSPVGARGLTQVMPRTARWLMPEIRTAKQLFEPETNLRVGFRYLRHLLDKYDGDAHLALLAYNRGPGTVDRILRRGGNPDNGYARRVLSG